MADLTFILTTAGFNALVNPANTGTNAVTIDRIGVSSVVLPGTPESNVGIVQLPNEIKRLDSFAGDVVGDNTIHVTIRDESAAVYALRTFGLYSSGGVLLAFYTQPTPIMEKAASSMLLLAADLQFTTPIAAQLVFGATNFINPPATTERQGVVELATAAETATGTDATRAVTPFGLTALLNTLLAGYSLVGHKHNAADVTAGTFAVARIPDLAMSKITGLAAEIAGRAALVHTHVMADITGLTAALGLKLAIADFTWNNLVGRPNVAVQDTDVLFKSIQTRNATPSDGRIYFGDQLVGGRRLDFIGDVWNFVGANVNVKGYKVWTSEDFLLSTTATANSVARRNGSGELAFNWGLVGDAGGLITASGRRFFDTGDGRSWAIRGTAANAAALQLRTSDDVNRGSFYADSNGNVGLLDGAGAWRLRVAPTLTALVVTYAGTDYNVWHSGTFTPADKANAIHSHDWAQVTGKPAGLLFNMGSCAEADLNAQQTSGFQTAVYNGHSRTLLTINAGGSPGPIQQEWHYNLNSGGWRVRNMQDSAAWGAWSSVVLATNNQGVISGTIHHSGNFDPSTKATLGSAVNFYSVQTAEGGIGGRLLLGNQSGGARELVYNGVNYYLNNAPLYINGSLAWTQANALDIAAPAGVIHYLATTTIPGGMRALAANGAAVSRSTYARLFGVIGTTYGAGDGATTFNLPDLRAVFVRGLDNGRGLDTGRGLNSFQDSQNKQHRHSIDSRSSTGSNNNYVEDADSDGTIRSTFTGYEGGNEARPVNEALLAVITY